MIDADTVVVGAGLGGLSAAVHLARAGERVLVLEGGHEPGGLATTFQRGPFRFEASLHLMDSVGPGEPNRPLIEALGLDVDVRWVQHPFVRRELWADRGWDLRIPQGIAGAIDAWASLFPADRAGMAAFFDYAKTIRLAADAYLERGDELPHRDQVEVVRLHACTATELLRRFVSAEAAELLGTLAGYQALPPKRIAALPFLVMMDGYHRAGSWYADGGSRAVTEALVRRIQAHGGEVVTDAEVVSAQIRRSRVTGLTLADGRTVSARRYVAAMSPLTVIGWAPDQFPERYRARIESLRLSSSLVRLSLGLDVDPVERWAADYEIWLMNWKDNVDREQIRLSITAPKALDPGCAPAGSGVIAITTTAEYGEPLDREREIARLVDGAERYLFPGLSGRVVERDLSHPHTYERYARVPRGSVFGFEATPDQSGVRRPGARTPISNLVLAGGWVLPGAGQVASMWSGRIAARHLLQGEL